LYLLSLGFFAGTAAPSKPLSSYLGGYRGCPMSVGDMIGVMQLKQLFGIDN
jgi:hypothetical protein